MIRPTAGSMTELEATGFERVMTAKTLCRHTVESYASQPRIATRFVPSVRTATI